LELAMRLLVDDEGLVVSVAVVQKQRRIKLYLVLHLLVGTLHVT